MTSRASTDTTGTVGEGTWRPRRIPWARAAETVCPMAEIEVKIIERPHDPGEDVLAFVESLAYCPAQHDPRWGRVYDGLDGESFTVAVARSGGGIAGICTFCRFDGPFGPILHGNPYMGYGGCSCRPDGQEEVIGALIAAMLDWARRQGCITATIAMPPFCRHLEAVYEAAMRADYRFENFHQYHLLDRHPLSGLKAKRRAAFASEIRRAEAAGVALDAASSGEEVDAWLDIYEARYAEIGATCLPRAYQKGLWETFAGAGRAELVLARRSGELLGGTLFLIGRGIVDYFSTAFRSDSMRLYPATLLLDRWLGRFLEAGVERFNWQSSPSRDSGVYAFKKRWGAEEAAYPILTRVLADPKPLLARPLAEVRAAYAGHFVLPYRLWENP